MRKDSQIERIRKGSSVREQRPPKSTQQKQLNPPKRPTSEVSEVPAGAVPKGRRSRTR